MLLKLISTCCYLHNVYISSTHHPIPHQTHFPCSHPPFHHHLLFERRKERKKEENKERRKERRKEKKRNPSWLSVTVSHPQKRVQAGLLCADLHKAFACTTITSPGALFLPYPLAAGLHPEFPVFLSFWGGGLKAKR